MAQLIPPEIWKKLSGPERQKLLSVIRDEVKRKVDEALKGSPKAAQAVEPLLTHDEKIALALIYNEMPTYAAQPTKELNEFHAFLEFFDPTSKVKLQKSLALLDPKNGAKMISDIVERDLNNRFIFVKNSGLLN